MIQYKKKLITILESANNKSPEAEADLILHHLKIKNLSEEFGVDIANQRNEGRPLHHILGSRYFFNHDYYVNEHTLIPRPETEILVSCAIQQIEKLIAMGAVQKNFKFAELGLGSGNISCEILAHFKEARGIASEVSPQAIAVAHQNLTSIISDWKSKFKIIEPSSSQTGFESLIDSGPFDFVFSNPPYVSVKDEIEEEVIKYEPHLALFPQLEQENENADFFYENFIQNHTLLFRASPKQGFVFFEIPHDRAEILLQKFKKGGMNEVQIIDDLTGRPRVLIAKIDHQRGNKNG